MTKSPFDVLRVGPVALRNRFIKSATNEGATPNGVATKALVRFHEAVAAGGAGMTTVAYLAVSHDGLTFNDQLHIRNDLVTDLRAVTDAVHAQGAAACAQLTHAGCFTFLPAISTGRPLSASGGFNKVGIFSGAFLRRAMTEHEMARIANEFVTAACVARESGFDAVEIHMGHGYLLSQFISPLYNSRRDRYGGTAENRARFPAFVLRQVMDAVGRDLAVICKVGVTDGVKGGATAEDAAITARQLEIEGAHMLVLSGGMNVESITTMFGSSFPESARASPRNRIVALGMKIQQRMEPKDVIFHEMYFMEHSRKVRAAVKMPLAYLGGVNSLRDAQLAVDEGFDAIALARPLLFDPAFIAKMRSGEETVTGCNRCNLCVTTIYAEGGTYCVLKGENDPQWTRTRAAV